MNNYEGAQPPERDATPEALDGQLVEKVVVIFCQHCQVLQKTNGLKVKPCWLLSMDRSDTSLICASANDAAQAILTLIGDEVSDLITPDSLSGNTEDLALAILSLLEVK